MANNEDRGTSISPNRIEPDKGPLRNADRGHAKREDRLRSGLGCMGDGQPHIEWQLYSATIELASISGLDSRIM
jgi:hypothetical protein